MRKPSRHLFVCVNQRPEGHAKGCCASKGGEALRDALKEACRKIDPHIRVSRALCLGPCELGANIVVYPEGTWYSRVALADVAEIVESHIKQGRPVRRLLAPITEEE